MSRKLPLHFDTVYFVNSFQHLHRSWTCFICACIFSILFVVSCTKEEFTTDPNDRLAFSSDSLTFDTVFTSRGSATRFIKIYNRHNRFLRIDRIYFEEGQESRFRANADGISGREFTNVDIPPEDSIYLFFEVTVDPDQPLSISPFVITEKVWFESNSNRESLVLQAWGQNANYLPNRFSAGRQNIYTCRFNEWVWDDPKPYVLFGVLVIDSCTLIMPAGTKVYVHGGIARTSSGDIYNDGVLYFARHGRLVVEGTVEEPVRIQGDRLESSFQETPGQWGRIQLGPLSRGHSINYVEIKNAIIGLLVDSLAEVSIQNSIIHTTSSSALVGYRSRITAENCLMHTSGGNNVSLVLGGNYNFTYCTLANYGTATEALSASNFTCLDGNFPCNEPVVAPLTMNFKNSIIYGSSRDMIALQDAVGSQDPDFFKYKFENCIVRVRDLTKPEAHPQFFDHCDPCINGDREETVFADPDQRDFHLDSVSIALEYAKPIFSISRDIEGGSRDPEKPDAGCYERSN